MRHTPPTQLLAGAVLIGTILSGFSASSLAEPSSAIEDAIKNGTVNGNIRIHYNERHYEDRPDAAAFAIGGALRAETAPLGIARIGVGYYTAQDSGLNNDDPARVDGRMGSDVEVLGEAYVNFSGWDSSLTVGRQKIVTPFANPIDVFIIPFTYEGISFKNNSIANLTLEFDYIKAIKSAGSDIFEDLGIWSTRRLGVVQTDTAGTIMLGGVYRTDTLALHGWFYDFIDLFTSWYGQADYVFSSLPLTPFVSAQYIRQLDAGESLLGTVDTTLYGVQGGISIDKAKLILGYNDIAENADAFNNGAFLAPYNFSTSPLYTNSMLQNMENVDSGQGMKFTFLYSFPSVELKVSHARLDFATIADLDATDVDVTYNLGSYLKGLSLRYRVEVVTSDSPAVEQSDHRLQLQYIF